MSLATRSAWQARLLGGETVPEPRRTNRHEEQGLMNAVMQALRLHPNVGWCARVNVGAYKTPDGRFVRFGFVGCPDIIGQLRDGRWLAIECKSDKGRVSEAQAAALERIREFNGLAGIARSLQDAISIVEGR